jgi:phage gp37-like protein
MNSINNRDLLQNDKNSTLEQDRKYGYIHGQEVKSQLEIQRANNNSVEKQQNNLQSSHYEIPQNNRINWVNKQGGSNPGIAKCESKYNMYSCLDEPY